MIMTTQMIAEKIIRRLKEVGIVIHRYDAYSSQSIYLKLDYGVCNSIRISDHDVKRTGRTSYLKYRYNVIIGGQTVIKKDKFIRYYYSSGKVNECINQIIVDRTEKINKYGMVNYQKYMKDNQEKSVNEKGFWAQAKLI